MYVSNNNSVTHNILFCVTRKFNTVECEIISCSGDGQYIYITYTTAREIKKSKTTEPIYVLCCIMMLGLTL